MKQTKLWLATIAALLCSITANAHDFEVDGIYYNITSSTDLTVAVTYRGSYVGNYSDEYTGAVTIPDTVTYNSNNYRVTSIGDYAFYNCSILTSITIPEGVTSIGDYAFDNCTSLKEVTFEDGSTTLSLGYQLSSGRGVQGLFYDCPLEMVYLGRSLSYADGSPSYSPFNASLKNLIITGSVTSIPSYLFYYCTNLTSITIPKSVSWIGVHAFYGCNLTSIVVETGNTNYYSHNNCNAIIEANSNTLIRGCDSTVIPEGVTSIFAAAFRGSSGLTSITIPESVTSIGDYAFNGCTSLKEVIIEDGSTTLSLGYNFYYSSGIGYGLFHDCPLETVYLGRNLSYSSSKPYGYSPFYKKDALHHVTIGNEVTAIADYAFYSCYSISTLILNSSLLSIGSNAFSTPRKVIWLTNTPPTGYANAKGSINYVANDQYTSLNNVKVYPYLSSMFEVEGVKYVPVSPAERTCDAIDCAYDRTAAAIKVNETVSFKSIAMTVKEVMPYTFHGNKHIKEVNVSHKGNIGNYAFYNCDSILSVELSNEGNVGNQAFYDCDGITTVVASNKGDINSKAFYDCDGINLLNISNIGNVCDEAFSDCGALETALVTNTGTVNGSAFYGCASLNSVTLGDKVTSLGNEVFRGCTSLQEIVIPDSVKSVGTYCFYGCTAMKSAVIGDGLTDVKEYTFANCSGLESVTIGNGVTSIRNYSFSACSSLNDVEIGSSVATINNYAFQGCSSLPTITIPQAVTTVGDNVFAGCSSLADVVIADRTDPLALGSNGSSALFADCPLDSVYIGGKIIYNTSSNYGYSPFYRNTSLRSVVITDREEQIYENEFYGCTNLQNVTIGNGVKSIGDYAFSGCSSLAGFSFGSNMESIGAEAFSDCTNLTSITSHAAVPPTCGTQALDDINKWECVLGVPQGNADAYYAADQWKEFFFIEDVVEVDHYVLTYMVDGEVYHTEVLKHKDEVTMLAEPTKVGYEFSGWDKTLATMPAEDVTINGTFTVNSYTLTYIVDGAEYNVSTVDYGTVLVPLAEPVKEGYTFRGWIGLPEIMPARDVVVTSSFVLNGYTLTYLVDGDTYRNIVYEYGSIIIAEPNPAKEGYSFSGWSGLPATMPAKDVTISGTFTINKYLVTFKIGDEVIAADSLEYKADIKVPEAPEKEGYTFNGWGEVVEIVPAGDLIYEGSYSANSYKLTYIVDDEVVQADSVAYGTEIIKRDEPTMEGYAFSGWSEIPATMPAKDVTITGTFTINKYLVTFKIGDKVIAADSLEYKAAIIAPEVPEKEGYTFNGWGEVAETVPAGDLTYEGSYSVNSYKLTYMVDGKVVQADSVTYGTEIIKSDEPTMEGYTFSGWSEIPATMPARDVTITGTFTINKYLVTFKIGDKVIAADSLEYKAAIIAPEVPEKEGYTFNGWGEVVEIVPAHDVTYEGTYTVNVYKVYYYVGEDLVHTAEVAYGESISEYVYEPTTEGDIFEGWVGENHEIMPAHDVVYIANITNGISLSTLKSQESVLIYDLQGRRILNTENLKSGIYIIDGKKTVIK